MVGIDAPEGRQTCVRDGRPWRCGDASRDVLRRLAQGSVTCKGEEVDQHDRLLAVCYAQGVDVNRAMVAEGAAVAYGRYRSEEAAARQARKGLWGSEFERPRDWRDKNMRNR